MAGEFIETDSVIDGYGTVTVPSSNDIIQIPEGDRSSGMMCFHSSKPIYETREEGTSDEILWNGTKYRILKVAPWLDFGFYKAFGVGMVKT